MPDAAMSANVVTTRQDMAEYLSQSLLSEYYERVEGRITRQVATSLKTYLVEVHLNGRSPGDALSGSSLVRVEPTRERTLWRGFDSRDGAYFLDFLNPRFPLVHTITYTNHSDTTLEKLVRNTRGVDHCWLPSSFLLNQELGQVIGFRFFHQRLTAGLEDSEEAKELAQDLGKPYPPAFRLSVSEYAHAEEDLISLRRLTRFGAKAAVESLAWRTARRDGSRQFIHDELWSLGKVTAYGTSWETHLANVLTVRDRYAALLQRFETAFALRWNESAFVGEPIEIRFQRTPITDLLAFVGDLVKGKPPFRLWGTFTPVSNQHIAVDALDLHTGHRLSLDVTPSALRVYLRTETCGNVLMRLISNVERYLSSEVQTSVDQLLVTEGHAAGDQNSP